ncbi:serine/threonine-protein phosphatase 6 regulatory ankyrin repeat subunit B-like [Mytilus californianus]|uniref:serine/threonine-protein phosphatase 6 regulatory ankyrin repeat subunit B-like n=1 Tax=Mytilus californianus TaxID=6549 RepID=UPI002246C882|nr:serine/threonine-protein phosphatase 6 regulatory ankyrin repeat subunit B-like [Mytilus californianus]
MVCLLRNFSKVKQPGTGYDKLPPPADKSEGADLARIKHYRNKMAHIDQNRISNADFVNQWTEISEAIGRLGGLVLVQECQNLRVAKLDQSNKHIMLELRRSFSQIEDITRTTEEQAKKIEHIEQSYAHKLEQMDKKHAMDISEIEKKKRDVISKDQYDFFSSIKETWKNRMKTFIVTDCVKTVLETVQQEQCVIITGLPGIGKSVIAYYVAFHLETTQGFDVLPVSYPTSIIDYGRSSSKQIFLFDDVVGKYSLDENGVNQWERFENNLIQYLIERPDVKILMTCRSNIFEANQNCKLGISLVQCNLMSEELKYSLKDLKLIAQRYISDDLLKELGDDIINMYPFFPLLCSTFDSERHKPNVYFKAPNSIIQTEINKLKAKSNVSFLALGSLVIFDNYVDKNIFRLDNTQDDHIIRCLWDESKSTVPFSKHSLFLGMKILSETYKYVKEMDTHFSFIHDKLYDIVSYNVGPTFKKSILLYGSSKFIKDRIQFATLNIKLSEYNILLDKEDEAIYFQRLVRLIEEGQNWEVFGNCQTQMFFYRESFIKFLESKSTRLTFKSCCDSGHTALHVCSSLGYVNFCFYLLTCGNIPVDALDNIGRTPMYHACYKGHYGVTKLLLKHRALVNLANHQKVTALHLACYKGHKNVAELLLKNGAEINQVCKKQVSALHLACREGHTKIAELLLHYKSAVKKIDEYGWTPLAIACNIGNIELSKLLLTHKAPINQRQKGKSTPLKMACANGHKEIVELLLANSASVNDADSDGWTPLDMACINGDKHIATLILNHRASVNKTNKHGDTPLHLACQYGHQHIARLLLSHHSPVNRANKELRTPLHTACFNNHTDMVEYLLNVDYVLVNVKDIYGWNSLSIACYIGSKDISELLLKQNIPVNHANKDGITPLYLACENGHKTVVELLLKYRASVNQTNKRGCTPLYISCQRGYIDVVSVLLLNNASVNTANYEHWAPLHISSIKGHKFIVEKLLECHALINQSGNKLWTPLHLACSEGHNHIVESLLKYDVDVNRSTANGSTPLKLACQEGYIEIAELLLLNHASVNQADNNNFTPLHIARENGHIDIENLLLKYDATENQYQKYQI